MIFFTQKRDAIFVATKNWSLPSTTACRSCVIYFQLQKIRYQNLQIFFLQKNTITDKKNSTFLFTPHFLSTNCHSLFVLSTWKNSDTTLIYSCASFNLGSHIECRSVKETFYMKEFTSKRRKAASKKSDIKSSRDGNKKTGNMFNENYWKKALSEILFFLFSIHDF